MANVQGRRSGIYGVPFATIWCSISSTSPLRFVFAPLFLRTVRSQHICALYGLFKICCGICHRQGPCLPLHLWRRRRRRPVDLDIAQWDQESMTSEFCSVPQRRSAKLTQVQEDGSNCSIFSFDITTNRSRLPLAKNALKKLRTLRHPGVIKVLDTVEVLQRTFPLREPQGHATDRTAADRHIHIYCDRASGAPTLACQTEEPQP